MTEEVSPLENHGWWMEQLRKDAKANRPEALRLADELDGIPLADMTEALADDAAAELRRLYAANFKLAGAIDMIRETLQGGNVDDLLYIINTALAEHRRTA